MLLPADRFPSKGTISRKSGIRVTIKREQFSSWRILLRSVLMARFMTWNQLKWWVPFYTICEWNFQWSKLKPQMQMNKSKHEGPIQTSLFLAKTCIGHNCVFCIARSKFKIHIFHAIVGKDFSIKYSMVFSTFSSKDQYVFQYHVVFKSSFYSFFWTTQKLYRLVNNLVLHVQMLCLRVWTTEQSLKFPSNLSLLSQLKIYLYTWKGLSANLVSSSSLFVSSSSFIITRRNFLSPNHIQISFYMRAA